MELSGSPKNGQFDNDWQLLLEIFWESPDYQRIRSKLSADLSQGIIVYPPESLRYRAFELTPLSSLRCVIIGQDPYHQEGQANGLAFSVNRGIALPPSLRNMLNELRDEYPNKSIQAIEHGGDLTIWAKQGVLLLNSLLSVQASNPLSHKNIGWESLLPLVIRKINEKVDDVVFLLWGKQAQSFKSLIDMNKHVVIEGVHPSPLSAYRGFFGSKPFSTINEILMSRGKSPIEW